MMSCTSGKMPKVARGRATDEPVLFVLQQAIARGITGV